MIKKFIEKVFGAGRKKAAAGSNKGKWKSFGPDEHRIRNEDISRGAMSVCEGLQQAGFQAYVVGGAVRDLLLGAHPKDFDVATDATPEQVRATFRRARIIGKRFRLVHVMVRDETIEVSTFRANHAVTDEGDANKARTDEHGRLLRDNVYGNREEDAVRRDFTMNALFYDPLKQQVWDWVGGVDDIQKKRVVMIGEPEARYREDPVRMLRAARLAAKLDFQIDPATQAPISTLTPLLENVPEARLYDEMLKLLLSGHALAGLQRLRALGLHRVVLPALDQLLGGEDSAPFVTLALERTDQRIASDRGVSPPFLFAALFWHPLVKRQQALTSKGLRPAQSWHEAMDDTLEAQRKSLAIPRRLDPLIKEIWISQPRFLQRTKAKAYRTLALPRFRACYDFFALRAEAGIEDRAVADWWEKFQFAEVAERESMLLPEEADEKKKRRRRRRKTSAGLGGITEESSLPETPTSAEGAA